MKKTFLALFPLLCLLAGCSSDTSVSGGYADTGSEPIAVVPLTWVSLAGTVADTLGNKDSADNPDEYPAHRVKLAPFSISKCEITRYQFAEVFNAGLKTYPGLTLDSMGSLRFRDSLVASLSTSDFTWTDSSVSAHDGPKNHPMVNISWMGAALFCNLLSLRDTLPPCYDTTGLLFTLTRADSGYRLPTEAEWEFAARGGKTFAASLYPSGNSISEYAGNLISSTLYPVGKFESNGFALFDMAGNAWEWCTDAYDAAYYATLTGLRTDPVNLAGDSLRVMRGGSFEDARWEEARCANRSYASPATLDRAVGFRMVKRN